MNEFPFPPPESLGHLIERLYAWFTASGGHLVVIFVALLALLLWQNRRPVTPSQFILWTAVILMGAGILELNSLAQPLLIAMGLTGVACTTWRRLRADHPLSSIQTIGGLMMISCITFLTWAFHSVVSEAPTPSRRSVCKNNLKQIGLALHNYEFRYRHLPALASNEMTHPRSWRVELLPFIDHEPLRRRYRDDEDWNSPTNTEIARERAARIYSCPSNPKPTDSERRFYSAYVAPDGPDTFLIRGRGRHMQEVFDGTSYTIAVMEGCGLEIVWTEPRDADLNEVPIGINLPGNEPGRSNGVMSSYHSGGAQYVMGDGAVRFLGSNTDPAVLKALLTATGGETVDIPGP